MSEGLPQMLYGDGIKKTQTLKFKGYNHNLYAGDGEIWDMRNMSSDHYPILAPREPRHLAGHMDEPNGIYARDRFFWAAGKGLYADGIRFGGERSCLRQFASLGPYIVILPDKAYYNIQTDEYGYLYQTWKGNVSIQDGTYAGAEASANTLYCEGANWARLFRVGDCVTISGCQTHRENNKSPIIREIDGDYMRFYENVFTINDSGDSEYVTIDRTVPDLDYICENDNRLWACRGDTIYCSKLGDPFNWNVFDGLATDSFAVDVGSAGDFTGCISYKGYPCFFKEDYIYKVYGDKPSNYQVLGYAGMGVANGSHRSLAITGETLFYLSRVGVMAYSGGVPQNVAAAFGNERYRNGVAGSDGVKYYISMMDEPGYYHLFVYDTRYNLWHREDSTEAVGFTWLENLYMQDIEGNLWLIGSNQTLHNDMESDGPVSSMVEFGDFTESDPNKKGTSKLQLRLELDVSAEVTISIQFDSNGVWQTIKTLREDRKRSIILPIIPRRSDHFRIRIEGLGRWRLYSLVRENYSGSDL